MDRWTMRCVATVGWKKSMKQTLLGTHTHEAALIVTSLISSLYLYFSSHGTILGGVEVSSTSANEREFILAIPLVLRSCSFDV